MRDTLHIVGYRVVRELGTGARSRVYLVHDRAKNPYALKHIANRSEADRRAIDQTIREHEIAGHLDHPALRKSHRIVRKRRLFRLRELIAVLEYVDGVELQYYRPPDLGALCRIGMDLCEGLHHMHQRGWVHADIKPQNILIDPQGRSKIIDLGQAARTGTVKQRIQGTPDYIAPEQVDREPITPRTDVYNFGATLYNVLTGEVYPSPMADHGNTRRRDPGPPSTPAEVDPRVPHALSQAVMACLARNPRDRPENIRAVCDRMFAASHQLKGDTPRGGPTIG